MITPNINYTNGQILPAGGVGSYNVPTPPSNFPTQGNPYAQNTPVNPSYEYDNNFNFDANGLRSKIATGELTPEQALQNVSDSFTSGQQKNGNMAYNSATGGQVADWKSKLFAPLQINAGNKIGNLNSDGGISQVSSTVHQSNTTGAGETSQNYYTQPTGGMLKAMPVPKSNMAVSGMPQLPTY